MNDQNPDGGLLLSVVSLERVQDRCDAHRSDPTGTSAGDDGENRDSNNGSLRIRD